MQNLYDELKWRGLLLDATEGLDELLAKEKVTGYIGFDPSAPSLHVGSLLTIMGLVRLQRCGHTPIAVVGGGTGLIGDPSFKATERPLLSKEQVQNNIQGIRDQLSKFLDFQANTNPAILVNNADWLCAASMVDFLRDVGKHFSVNAMVAKESIKRRIEQEGISYTEFSYILLQSYDFLTLFEKYNCTLQLGGSDQWGNITSGIDLIRRVHGQRAHGLVWPLLLTSAGTKFGKTETGTVWLDPELTSPYRFYQFWFNTDDEDVIKYIQYFTFSNQEEVQALAESLAAHPEKREAQKTLARFLTGYVHGQEALQKVEQASRILFGEAISNLSLHDVLDVFANVPSIELKKSQLSDNGMDIVELVNTSGLVQSKGEARRLIQSGGIYLNNIRVSDPRLKVTLSDAVEGQVLVLRKGQKEYRLIKAIES